MTSAFDKLARPVQKWVRRQGWRELREVQAKTVHAVFDSESDVIVAASTAGGKTEAAFLPLISQVLDAPDEKTGFDILYIGPLKALITDQARRLEDICQESGCPVVPWHGDVSASIKTKALKQPRGVLLITPESLEALFVRRGLSIARLFDATRAVVIDELHSVLDSERGVQMRSLLTRLELKVGRTIRRIGLSATLGDMDLARTYLRPDRPDDVAVIESKSDEAELLVQLRGYVAGEDAKPDEDSEEEPEPSATDRIAEHLFRHLRSSDNLVFAGARQSVEIYADRLRSLCEDAHLPQEFFPHHASLSREHREFVERRLKDGRLPTTAICTSTLELGIDIGDVTTVAQIGAPFSVASLRQRLGRSGRRPGKPAILRQYAVETKLEPKSNIVDRLRLRTVRAVAMIELLLENWCEPPRPQALHLSTLVHQILSVIAEHGGAKAPRIFKILCQAGPFRSVTAPIFADVLRAIGNPEIGLIEQQADGLLLLGPEGEKLVEHYSFYAVFQTPEEYRLVTAGRELGTMPIDNVVAAGTTLIFSGRRWEVREVHDRDHVIVVAPSRAGVPPRFGGDAGIIHDHVVERMFVLLEGTKSPAYLDQTAKSFLEEARDHFERLELKGGRLIQTGEYDFLIATRRGTIATTTLALALQSEGMKVQIEDGFLEVNLAREDDDPFWELRSCLRSIANGKDVDLFASSPNLAVEKFHRYLTDDLLNRDALASRLNAGGLSGTCRAVLGMDDKPKAAASAAQS
ncbi:MAG: DEAD/DEAH box helicase [Fulvimarina manganoxydans]|uniref:DEAD/DEAH box helicase n=1 Tax=Fulvimarina manganoxydans TaxID=937218 RepID=UPI002356F9A3|nr:DEAD/DEAH box helicase [Fulvimarina manganoxydans]MCK5930963.1 DEAD/DEAH box helicase [Fulvimarina manganoxydans]